MVADDDLATSGVQGGIKRDAETARFALPQSRREMTADRFDRSDRSDRSEPYRRPTTVQTNDTPFPFGLCDSRLANPSHIGVNPTSGYGHTRATTSLSADCLSMDKRSMGSQGAVITAADPPSPGARFAAHPGLTPQPIPRDSSRHWAGAGVLPSGPPAVTPAGDEAPPAGTGPGVVALSPWPGLEAARDHPKAASYLLRADRQKGAIVSSVYDLAPPIVDTNSAVPPAGAEDTYAPADGPEGGDTHPSGACPRPLFTPVPLEDREGGGSDIGGSEDKAKDDELAPETRHCDRHRQSEKLDGQRRVPVNSVF